jgi:hypothetical protein
MPGGPRNGQARERQTRHAQACGNFTSERRNLPPFAPGGAGNGWPMLVRCTAPAPDAIHGLDQYLRFILPDAIEVQSRS